jgi:hypothetical protein
MPAWFYILQLRSDALYAGATENLAEGYRKSILLAKYAGLFKYIRLLV